MTDMGEWDSVGDGNSALVLFLEDNVRWLFVDSNTKALELILDDSLVSQGLVHIQDDENEMTSLGNSNNLATSTLAIFGSLNYSRQIEHLDCGSIVLDLTRYGSQSSEFVCSRWQGVSSYTADTSGASIPSECCPVNLLMRVLFPTEGKPMNPTLATPVLATSKPAARRQR